MYKYTAIIIPDAKLRWVLEANPPTCGAMMAINMLSMTAIVNFNAKLTSGLETNTPSLEATTAIDMNDRNHMLDPGPDGSQKPTLPTGDRPLPLP